MEKDDRIAVIEEIIASVRKTKTYRNIEQSDALKLVELMSWFDDIVIDTFTRLVGIDEDDLEQVYQDAFNLTRNIDVEYVSDLYDQTSDELGTISFIYAWTFRELVRRKIEGLFKDSKIGIKAREVIENPKSSTKDVEELLQQIKQIGKAGIRRLVKTKGLKAAGKRMYVIRSIHTNTLTEEEEEEQGQDILLHFTEGYELARKSIDTEDFDSLQLPTATIETPHPDWERFITKKTQQKVKSFVAKKYILYTDVKKMISLCGPALDAAAYKQTSGQETFEKDEKDTLFQNDPETGEATGEEKYSDKDRENATGDYRYTTKLDLHINSEEIPEVLIKLFEKKENFPAIVAAFRHRKQGYTYEQTEKINQDTMRRYVKMVQDYVEKNGSVLIDKERTVLNKKELKAYNKTVKAEAKQRQEAEKK